MAQNKKCVLYGIAFCFVFVLKSDMYPKLASHIGPKGGKLQVCLTKLVCLLPFP